MLLHNQSPRKYQNVSWNELLFIFRLQCTGLTGLAVSKHPHKFLASVYGKILRTLAKMPENAAYRIHTEQIVKDRASVIASVIENFKQQ